MTSSNNNNRNNNGLLSHWSSIGHWRKLCPYLTISENSTTIAIDPTHDDDLYSQSVEEKLLERLIDDGYAPINKDILPSTTCSDNSSNNNANNGNTGSSNIRENLVRGITELEVVHSLPATFILLFDETWKVAARSHHLLLRQQQQTMNQTTSSSSSRGILHPNQMAFNFDMLAWYIDPRQNQAGFSPHRDRQPETSAELQRSFYDDGQAKYVTHWIALTDATPENSCLYVIPREYDPGYLKGDDPPDEEGEIEEEENDGNNTKKEKQKQPTQTQQKQQNQYSRGGDPLTRALTTKQSYQNIRAIPRASGQSLIFTHRILHWGSRGNPNSIGVSPRIAISFVYSDVEFEAPYLTKETLVFQYSSYSSRDGNHPNDDDNNGNHHDCYWTCPPFPTRLLLVCAQLLIYYQRFNLSTSTLRACYDYCKLHEEELHPVYRKKVFVEYVKARRETKTTSSSSSSASAPTATTEDAGEMDGKKMKGDGDNDDTTRKQQLENENTGEEEENNNNNDGPNNDSEDEEALLEEMLNHCDEFDDDYDDMDNSSSCESEQQQQNDSGSNKRKRSG